MVLDVTCGNQTSAFGSDFSIPCDPCQSYKALWFLAIAPTEAGRSRAQIKETDTSLPSRYPSDQSGPHSLVLEVSGTKRLMVGQNSSLYMSMVCMDCVLYMQEHLEAQARNLAG